MNNEILSSYDDYIEPNWAEYAFDNVLRWLLSCKHQGQIKAAYNAIRLFRQQFPREKGRYQNLFRAYWKLHRELNTYN